MATSRVLIIGASGTVGSQVVKELDKNNEGVVLRLATSRPEAADKWRAEGREAVVLDLNRPETFAEALAGVDRVFLLTGYTSDMLFQSKKLVDASVDSGVSHIVHLGVFTSRRDLIPHFNWHDLVETYIEASGIAWTHLHPNVITDTVLATVTETNSFTVNWSDMPQGWVFAADIAAVAAAVLREGPEKHGGANYWLSTEVLTGPEVADILTAASGKEIKCNALDPASLEEYVAQIKTVPERAYMESAIITMKLAAAGQMTAQTVVRDDVLTVLGRPGITMAEWARHNFN
ncbi:NmrA family NAD(P)-binding protein [Paenibacillus gallinarum]|uniref:NmrA family NAD(P)-binding protein n=1 Tax=Paenibacillus gallinarum TaxID=2762232 RepID=A0ABR8T1U8_9BACL|nr:NmrA family NAD(P)-binding protein [Paenibacillus gallinarum]MBD7969574.1 NmrA family NAD(P)-binding protein [Paenibacillus gallinarum]